MSKGGGGGAVGWRRGEYRREGKGGRRGEDWRWEAGEIGEHYAKTLTIAPSKKSSKMGWKPEMQGTGVGRFGLPCPPYGIIEVVLVRRVG